ncbi:hypothetical protein TruAng_008723 [Truncatella angustata]|nr:hypothetical protein TruAng_008723 [Truncatella angustata]
MANYSLIHHWAGQGLLDAFTFLDSPDPSKGFVNYQDYESAVSQKLVTVDVNNKVKLGVDSTNIYDPNTDVGRPSVRLTSNEVFNYGLFIADFERMPASACGSWPAFWALNNQYGNVWPTGGEIDIIEGQNDAETNLFAAHTSTGCSVAGSGYNGILTRSDCNDDYYNRGCTYSASDKGSYGDTFNAAGGGVYAMEWTEERIKIWHFRRSEIPDDISFAPLQTPDPSTWGAPQALFGGPSESSCETDKYFFNLSLAININFCGDYAGNLWNQSDCALTRGSSCTAFVASNPQAFVNSFWLINSIDIYMVPDNTTTATNSTMPPFPANSTTTPFTRVTISTADPTAVPTGANGGFIDDEAIGGYSLLGCFGSAGGYQNFQRYADLPDMDNDVCVESCKSAHSLGDAAATNNNRCNIPCPGCDLETCGGFVNGSAPGQISTGGFNSTNPDNTTSILPRQRVNSRDAPADVLLTVYGNLTDDIPPPPPGIEGDNGTGSRTVTAGANVTLTTAVTVSYTTICATNPAELVILEYCTTITIENCPVTTATTAPAPGVPSTSLGNAMAVPTTAVPMKTCVETCSACGPKGESTVTLTIPLAIATGGDDIVVTAISVVTVLPLNGSYAAAGDGSVAGTSAAVSAIESPSQLPVIAGADSVFSIVTWGVMLWLGVFGVMIVV